MKNESFSAVSFFVIDMCTTLDCVHNQGERLESTSLSSSVEDWQDRYALASLQVV